MYKVSRSEQVLTLLLFANSALFTITRCGSASFFEENVGSVRHHIEKRIARYQPFKCSDSKFACNDGCYDKSLLCDGVKDCSDGADESIQVCRNNTCHKNQFRCEYGGCLTKDKVCNGVQDCYDGTDEKKNACQENICPSDKFRCNNGVCISKSFTCDGSKDCSDGSDETAETCSRHQCNDNEFRCQYGGCINKILACDGFTDCVDISDEAIELCEVKPGTNVQGSNNCILPRTTDDKYYNLECPDTRSRCFKKPGIEAPQYSQITYFCNFGYLLEDDSEPNFSICKKGQWLPQARECKKKCDLLRPKGVDLNCYRTLQGAKVACSNNLLAGTIVYPQCKSLHHMRSNANYRYLTCQPNGKWTDELFQCIPDCGKSFGNATNLIKDGKPDRTGDSPWHVAIYSTADTNTPILICGGTIITPQLIVSAAHCFFDEGSQERGLPSNYEIAVSKVTRSYKQKDRPETKFYKIQKIFFPDVDFVGDATNYAADIAVLWILGTVTFNYAVLPACIEWTHYGRFNPGENVYGKLVGWGNDGSGQPSEVLLAATLPYVSYSDCRKIVNQDFKNSISPDKFCAGTQKGAGARQGDSGGGLLFRDRHTELYYLRGIVSNKDSIVGPNESSIATFTDVAQYLDWIVKIDNEVEKRNLESDTSLRFKT